MFRRTPLFALSLSIFFFTWGLQGAPAEAVQEEPVAQEMNDNPVVTVPADDEDKSLTPSMNEAPNLLDDDTKAPLFKETPLNSTNEESLQGADDDTKPIGGEEESVSPVMPASPLNAEPGEKVPKNQWVVDEDGKRYYADNNGEYFKNQIITFGNIAYYMGADGSVQFGVVSYRNNLYFADPETGILQKSAGWIRWKEHMYYAKADGSLFRKQIIGFGETVRYYMGDDGSVQYGFFTLKDTLYYANPETGLLRQQAGWLEQAGKRYYVASNGQVFRNQFITFGTATKYYMGQDGSVQTGFLELSNGLYYAYPETGLVRQESGWFVVDAKQYYSAPGGRFFHHQFITFGENTKFYMGDNGAVQTGLFSVNGETYYAAPTSGRIALQQWVDLDGKRYFADPAGRFYRNQFISFGSNTRYYMGADGSLQKGTIFANGTIYRLHPETGVLIQKDGWFEHEGKTYYMQKSGLPFRNQLISFGETQAYYMGSDGSMQKNAFITYKGNLYYAPENGNLYSKTGWLTKGGQTYYVMPNHTIRRNAWISFASTYYYCQGDGAIAKNTTLSINNVPYAFDANGIRENRTGWHTIKGNLYYFNTAGFAHTGWLSVDGKRYYAGSNAVLYRGLQTINGRKYYFDENSAYPHLRTDVYLTINGEDYYFDETGAGALVREIWNFRRFSYDGHRLKIKYANGNLPNVRDVGRNHVLISIVNQYMWIFNNGQLVMETPIISGKPSTPTVTGFFSVTGMARNVVLRGDDYATPVSYWIQFYPSYGIHDAGWQSGGNFYMDSDANYYVGSHGCVNVPSWRMPQVWDCTYTGMPVTVMP